MNFQEKSNIKNFAKFGFSSPTQDLPKSSLLINSSFSIATQQKPSTKQITQQVLKKVSQTIVSLHSTLVPKTENIEIYRDLSQDELKMLSMVQDNQLIHTILAGVLAIDSCLKHIGKQETYAMSSLMKGVTICLGNFRKVEEQCVRLNDGRISENLLKFYDCMKLIISDLHKMPAARIKKNEIQKHIQLLNKSQLSEQLLTTLNREQNLLFSLLAQQNSSQRQRINQLQKDLSLQQREKTSLLRQYQQMDSDKKKRDTTENNLTETDSDSRAYQDQLLIKELKEQVTDKNEIILKMNHQFTVEIEKYDKIFKRLEDQNKLLKKYNDLDTAYILEELEYQVEILREEKKNNQSVLNQVINQMNSIAWNKPQGNVHTFNKDNKARLQPRLTQHNTQRQYENQRNRCPSVSPSQKQQNHLNRYFSPPFQTTQHKRNQYKNFNGYEKKQSQFKRDNSPRFGNVTEQNNYENPKNRVSRMAFEKQLMEMQGMKEMRARREYNDHNKEGRKSQHKASGMRISQMGDQNYEINKLKKQMRRSKFLNSQMAYM